ncbi:leucyl/phenylalanyl-tRNA--protein transferase [Pseudohalioglobus lutimaris]|uniref:Leucyl/phenylalanyl-tRNA--protein transferase n=1 Tax=Pseudohalioglobus lutimaris TaxID=1737061 RepID=A0A2N5WY99_9GAMM|nr:leucyl/phenylalanyl-tRNA--protein transferase [Pseudohalioglobus lutimaris]PLW67200.1 leucyl/phenylalanyl-tRNA--protein transferase [Pseudohalioglobus lutimaris]
MRALPQLHHSDAFPPTSEALDYPNGLLAVGGGLSASRLTDAYRRGIFPWYEEPQPVLWWTPDPRSVLFPERLHISRSLRKTLRKDAFKLSVDQHFEVVMRRCAQLRGDGLGTWIGDDMLAAYCDLHHIGHAHSIEVLNQQNELVGGLYGIALGRAFFGESMFSAETDASKVALVGLIDILSRGGFRLVDCQVESEHLNSLGAINISRLDFEELLAQTVDIAHDPGIWHLPATCGELL